MAIPKYRVQGSSPRANDSLTISANIGEILLVHSFSTRAFSPSGPVTLFCTFNPCDSLATPIGSMVSNVLFSEYRPVCYDKRQATVVVDSLLILLPLWDSVIVLFFDVRYFVSILVLQSSRWERELVALLSLSSWCLVIVVWLFLMMPLVCLQVVIVVFPDHTHLLFFMLICGCITQTSLALGF